MLRHAVLGIVAILFLLGASVPLQASDADSALRQLRARIDRYCSLLPCLERPDLSAVEELVSSSPARAAEQLVRIDRRFSAQIERSLVLEVVRIGRALASSPTDGGNYIRRRKLLVELQALWTRLHRPTAGLFPGGSPQGVLPVGHYGTTEYERCDGMYAHLAMILSDRAERLKSQSPAGHTASGAGEATGAPERTAPGARGLSGQRKRPRTITDDDGLSGRRADEGWKTVVMYLTYTFYLLAAFAVLGILYQFGRGAAGLSDLTAEALKAAGSDYILDETPPNDPVEAFKAGMLRFRKNRYDKALACFRRAADLDKGGEIHDRAACFVILCLTSLGKLEQARSELDLLELDGLSGEDLYRLASAFEEAGDCPMALVLFEKVADEDDTLRDVKLRIRAVKNKIAEDVKDGPDETD